MLRDWRSRKSRQTIFVRVRKDWHGGMILELNLQGRSLDRPKHTAATVVMAPRGWRDDEAGRSNSAPNRKGPTKSAEEGHGGTVPVEVPILGFSV